MYISLHVYSTFYGFRKISYLTSLHQYQFRDFSVKNYILPVLNAQTPLNFVNILRKSQKYYVHNDLIRKNEVELLHSGIFIFSKSIQESVDYLDL